jgi:hypothetical protein
MNKTLRDPLILLIVLALGIVIVSLGFCAPRYYYHHGNRYGLIHKIQDCIDHWHPECADLDFSRLNGVEKGLYDLTGPAAGMTVDQHTVIGLPDA